MIDWTRAVQPFTQLRRAARLVAGRRIELHPYRESRLGQGDARLQELCETTTTELSTRTLPPAGPTCRGGPAGRYFALADCV